MLSIEETEAPDLEIQRAKKITVSCAGETTEFQEDRNLFVHMIVIRKSRPEKLSEHTNLEWFHDRC